MTTVPADEGDDALEAGDFGSWLGQMRAALRGERDADVPCGDCSACCRSAQFVHVDPDEADTLAHIPSELLFPAPGLPDGHLLLGHDERGQCPLLLDGRCSVYAHRPRACRTFDCRIFAATGVTLDDERKAGIAAHAARWRFEYADRAAVGEHEALRSGAAAVPSSDPYRRAVAAVDGEAGVTRR